MEKASIKDWSEFKKSFQEFFISADIDESWWAELENVKQGEVSVNELQLTLEKLFVRLEITDDKIKKRYLLKSLEPELEYEVEKEGPKAYGETMKFMKKAEMLFYSEPSNMNPNKNIELPDCDEEMVDDEPTLEQLENSLLETSNDDLTLNAMGKKKNAITPDEVFESNEKRRAFLKSRKDQKNSYQEKRKVHSLEVETAWEPCFISTIQHSLDKSAWDRNYGWTYAKNIIKTKFNGDRSQSHYLQQLIEMIIRSTLLKNFITLYKALAEKIQQPTVQSYSGLCNNITLTLSNNDIAPILSVEELISERRSSNHYSRVANDMELGELFGRNNLIAWAAKEDD
ncbi:hypothetical protein BCR42DRAFT_444033 [Absidia repens]|uniref:Uncharacterized protein n=1 Tax=Absidia repens TaxID=90262 RepID=A0A1X2HXL0_9FUNG|nr:hypothetical protein BCR42DRAFT_444033 [Absidia repens]